MTRYNEDAGDADGDFDDQLDYHWQGGYREGVEAVLDHLDSEANYQIQILIDDGVI